jgi:predicted extracellular nuclease
MGQQAFDDGIRGSSRIRVVFYNVENLFDADDDPKKRDDDFTPEGGYRYDNRRKTQKLKNTARVVINVGGWEAPEIVGFCEIENRNILEQLNQNTPLNQWNYRIVHFESPDRRGIDVGLFVRTDKIRVIAAKRLPVVFPWDSTYKTRDILWATLQLSNKEILHVFVNHWPSRYGGQLQTVPSRAEAARTAKRCIDSILRADEKANVLMMGDFNDHPTDASMQEVLTAKADDDPKVKGELINLMYALEEKREGTHKFQGVWGVLDQIVVSDALLDKGNVSVKGGQAHVFKADYLLETDQKYSGTQPFRTYIGFSYQGGYSDHLPVYCDIELR